MHPSGTARPSRRRRSAASCGLARAPRPTLGAMALRQVYLVPGFFGFAHMEALTYFQGVAESLTQALERRGVEAQVLECRTQPTASIRRRAEHLVDVVRENGGLEAEEIHFVGHSTGGLDVRLLTTPGVRLRATGVEAAIAARTRSVVTVATPHFGTPLAGFFTTLLGRQVLELLAVLATSWGGRLGLAAAAQLLTVVARADDWLGRTDTVLDSLTRSLLSRVGHDESGELWRYLREVASDQGAVIQLMPEAMHLFNAAVTDDPRIHYASLVTAAPPPPYAYSSEHFLSLAGAALAGGFTLLHTLAAREHRHYPYPHPGTEVLRPFRRKLPFPLRASSNDGIVPTFSQVYGRVLDVVLADHLDVVGQFHREAVPHGDWLPSGSGFGPRRFARTWGHVAEAIASASGPRAEAEEGAAADRGEAAERAHRAERRGAEQKGGA